MSKQAKRWPIWKIALATGGCAVVAAVLFWLSALVEGVSGEQTTTPIRRSPALTVSSFVMMLAVGAVIFGVLGVIWLAFRIREARMPAWDRRAKKRRH